MCVSSMLICVDAAAAAVLCELRDSGLVTETKNQDPDKSEQKTRR